MKSSVCFLLKTKLLTLQRPSLYTYAVHKETELVK